MDCRLVDARNRLFIHVTMWVKFQIIFLRTHTLPISVLWGGVQFKQVFHFLPTVYLHESNAMCPNVVQRTVAALDLASAQLAKHNVSCVRHPLDALEVIRETLLNAFITIHLNHARDAIANGDRTAFERRCEHASHLAQWHAPDRLDDVEEILKLNHRSDDHRHQGE